MNTTSELSFPLLEKDRQTDRQTDRQRNKDTDRQKKGQTYKHTRTPTHKHTHTRARTTEAHDSSMGSKYMRFKKGHEREQRRTLRGQKA